VNLKSILESILFSVGEPIAIEKLAKTIDKNRDVVEKTIENLENDYQKEDRGLRQDSIG